MLLYGTDMKVTVSVLKLGKKSFQQDMDNFPNKT